MGKKRGITTVFCSVCKRGNKHDVLRDVERTVFHEEIGEHYWDKYEILQCCGCENVSFKHTSGSSEDLDDEGQPIFTNKLYPNPYIREPIADHY
jgi:hypothetical protein